MVSSTEGLVGREAELALAAAAVRQLSEGRASVLVIGASPGPALSAMLAKAGGNPVVGRRHGALAVR